MYWQKHGEAVSQPMVSPKSGEKRQNIRKGCRLFGIELVDNSNAEGKVEDEKPVKTVDANPDRHAEPSSSNVPSANCVLQIRSCTKVSDPTGLLEHNMLIR